MRKLVEWAVLYAAVIAFVEVCSEFYDELVVEFGDRAERLVTAATNQ